jgi:hypothetical protein
VKVKVGDLIRFKHYYWKVDSSGNRVGRKRTMPDDSSFYHVLEVLEEGVYVMVVDGNNLGKKHFILFDDKEIEVISEGSK